MKLFKKINPWMRVIGVAGAAAFLAAGECPASAADAAGRAVSVTGRVLVRNESISSGQIRQLAAGDVVRAGDVINTSSEGNVKLLMTDQTILDLGGATLFKVDEYQLKNVADRNVQLNLDYGKMRASVNTPVGKKGKFQVRTRSATMGVRGTEFVVASDWVNEPVLSGAKQPQSAAESSSGPDAQTGLKGLQVKTQVTVLHGNVAVTVTGAKKQNPVAVTDGKQLTAVAQVAGDRVIASAAAPQVAQLAPAQLKEAIAAAKVEDTTFHQAVTIEKPKGSDSTRPSAALSDLVFASAAPVNPGAIPNIGPTGPGTFGSSIHPVPINGVPVGIPVTVKVVFVK